MNPPPLPENHLTVELVRTGQRLLISGLVLFLAFFPLKIVEVSLLLSLVTGIGGILAIVLSILGTLRVTCALKYHLALRICGCLCMIVPAANVVALLVLTREATSYLRTAGFRVGLFGAAKKTLRSSEANANPPGAAVYDRRIPLHRRWKRRILTIDGHRPPLQNNQGT